MILSRKHRYIFLHCRKTAGSSISVALARHLGPDDLQLSGLRETSAAGIALPDRVVREARLQAATLTRNKRKRQLELTGALGRERRMLAVTKLIRDRYRPALGHHCQHAPAAALRAAFPEDWAECRKFCVVRNPWDKVVSDYFWRIRKEETPPSFDSFVRAMRDGDPLGGVVPVEVADNWPLYTINDQIIADEVIRYESLATELPVALDRLNVPWDGILPRAKGSHRPKSARGDKASLYTPELIAIVGHLFAREIDAFGYDFDGHRMSPAAAS